MAHLTVISKDTAISQCNNLISLLDENSTIDIYSGEVPTDLSVDLGISQVLLVSIPLPFPAFNPAADVGGKATSELASQASAFASSSGLATFFRVVNSSGNPVWQGKIGLLNYDLDLSSTVISAGVSVRIRSLKISVPEIQIVCS